MSFTLAELPSLFSQQHSELCQTYDVFSQEVSHPLTKTFELKVDGVAISVIVEMARRRNPNAPKEDIIFRGKMCLDQVKVNITPATPQISQAIAEYLKNQFAQKICEFHPENRLFDDIVINNKYV